MVDKTIKFTELDGPEGLSKFKSIYRNKYDLKLWKNKVSIDLDYHFVKDVSLTKVENKIQINLDGDTHSDNSFKDVNYLTFNLNGNNYINKIRYLEADQKIIVDRVYRDEKRSIDRVLLFPHFEGYLFIESEVKKTSDENIIPFLPKDRVAFNSINKFCKLINEEGKTQVGFRLIDINENGASFIASKDECDTLSKLKEFSNLKIQIECDEFFIDHVSIKYRVNYLDSRMKNLSMYKLGISFEVKNNAIFSWTNKINSKHNMIIDSIDEFMEFSSD